VPHRRRRRQWRRRYRGGGGGGGSGGGGGGNDSRRVFMTVRWRWHAHTYKVGTFTRQPTDRYWCFPVRPPSDGLRCCRVRTATTAAAAAAAVFQRALEFMRL